MEGAKREAPFRKRNAEARGDMGQERTERKNGLWLQLEISGNREFSENTALLCKSGLPDGSRVSWQIKGHRDSLEMKISFFWPILDICGIWYPNCGKERSLQADWAGKNRSTACISAPVICLFNEEGRNRLTFALEEAAKEVFFCAGVREEDGTLSCEMALALKEEELPYRTRLYISWEDQGFAEALDRVAAWWETECKMTPMEVPEAARLPMYSAWYSYHQDIRADVLEKEAALAKRAGFETLIVDDG